MQPPTESRHTLAMQLRPSPRPHHAPHERRHTPKNAPNHLKTTLPTLSTPSLFHSSPHICPFSAPLAPFLPSTPPTAHRTTLTPSQPQNQAPQPSRATATPRHKKGESSPHSHPRQQYNSTHFNLSPFNLHPKLNTPVNNLQPKFNPLQPFAHFVFSALTHTSTPNSLIYTLFLVFTLNTLLYISFSCPYILVMRLLLFVVSLALLVDDLLPSLELLNAQGLFAFSLRELVIEGIKYSQYL